MPEVENGRPGAGEMIKWLIGKSPLSSQRFKVLRQQEFSCA
jgi:hypothetical protein